MVICIRPPSPAIRGRSGTFTNHHGLLKENATGLLMTFSPRSGDPDVLHSRGLGQFRDPRRREFWFDGLGLGGNTTNFGCCVPRELDAVMKSAAF